MTQVKIKLNAGDLPAAGKVYQKLKKLAPQSDEVIEARELIKAAVYGFESLLRYHLFSTG
jgi:hypothetical protein